jgi:hypothetical protein
MRTLQGTTTFTKEDVPTWKTGYVRLCIFEVLLCAIGVTVPVVFEYLKKDSKPRIAGAPDQREANRRAQYNVEEPGSTPQLSPDIRPPRVVQDLTNPNQHKTAYDPIHEFWLNLSFHVISLGCAFHHSESVMMVVFAYLHGIIFAGYVYLEVFLRVIFR